MTAPQGARKRSLHKCALVPFGPRGPRCFSGAAEKQLSAPCPVPGQGNRPALPCRPAPFGACRVSRARAKGALRSWLRQPCAAGVPPAPTPAPGGSRVKGAKRPRLAGAARSPERARTRASRGAPLMRLEPSTLRAGVQDRRPKAACPAPLPRGERLPSPAGRGAGGSGYGRQRGRKAPRSA